jgi:hypothetical protein
VKNSEAVHKTSRPRDPLKGDGGNRPIRQPKTGASAGRQKRLNMERQGKFAALGIGGLTRASHSTRPVAPASSSVLEAQCPVGPRTLPRQMGELVTL